MAINQQELFESLFGIEAIVETFNSKYAETQVRGYDALTGAHVKANAEQVFKNVAKKCADSSFRFIPYKEKLILKGRNSHPRMTSIPSVRDRVVFKQLNSFLTKLYPETCFQNKPKRSIEPIIGILQGNASENVWVYGGDLKKFFDKIPHERLLAVLEKRIQVKEILNLIRHALKTPTLPNNTPKGLHYKYANEIGVPQGISIAGTLASIYMLEVDGAMVSNHPGVNYCRYVDDILIVGFMADVEAAKATLHSLVRNIGLELHDGDKENFSSITKKFQFLGYQFQLLENNYLSISVRSSSVERVYQRFLKIFEEERNQKKRIEVFGGVDCADEKSSFDSESFLLRLNTRITGFIMKETKEYRGWLAYYNQINDLELLYRFDHFIKMKLKEYALDKYIDLADLKSFVRAYHESRHSLYSGYIPTFTNNEVAKYCFLDDLDDESYSNL